MGEKIDERERKSGKGVRIGWQRPGRDGTVGGKGGSYERKRKRNNKISIRKIPFHISKSCFFMFELGNSE